MLIHDLKTQERLDRLAPHLGVLDTKKPRTISGHIGLPAPSITTVSEYIHGGK